MAQRNNYDDDDNDADPATTVASSRMDDGEEVSATTMFFEGLVEFIDECHQMWEECEETDRQLKRLLKAKGNADVIQFIIEKWHEQMSKECYQDEEGESHDFYYAIDKKNLNALMKIEESVSILRKLQFSAKLKDLLEDEETAALNVDRIFQHFIKINNQSRVVYSIPEGVRSTMHKVTMEMAEKVKRREPINLKPIQLGSQIMQKYSSDESKRQNALDHIINNAEYLVPAIENMKQEMATNSKTHKSDFSSINLTDAL